MKVARPQETAWRAKVGEMAALQERLSRKAYETAASSQARSTAMAIGLVVAAVCAGAFIGWRITASVRRPIQRAMRVVERIAEGDLSSPVEVGSGDEIGRLLHGMGTMQGRLRTLVAEIRESADSVRVASEEVAVGNADLSVRTEQAAAQLQQTASSMDEFAGRLRTGADAANIANDLAGSAVLVARRGGEVVQQVMSTMDDIDSASKKISEIIGTIDSIAFQTNILALNAAVEAARAGEQGRGFAVVAGEVRGLAQRSATAAKEIKALIGDSVERIDSGSRLVRDAGTTMTAIVASVQRVTDIVSEIQVASAEQKETIVHVHGAVASLDRMTQQNAALVEESAAAAESLKEQSRRLTQLVGSFQTA